MSVEQALQQMMGESSDTEMEVCANTDADGTTKVKPVISHRDTKGRSTPNEGSIDEETEELRLVLSPEDDSVKVEDESQSAGEGSLNDSFTLALSSPDSTGNDKSHLETDTGNESTDMKSDEPVIESSDSKEDNTEVIDDKIEKSPTETAITSETSSADEVAETVEEKISSDSCSLDVKEIESTEQPAEVPKVQSDDDVVTKSAEPITSAENAEVKDTSDDKSCPVNESDIVQTEGTEEIKSVTVDAESNAIPETKENEDFHVDTAYDDAVKNTDSMPILPTEDSVESIPVSGESMPILPTEDSGESLPISSESMPILTEDSSESTPILQTDESSNIAENTSNNCEEVNKTTNSIPEEELKTEIENIVSEMPEESLPETDEKKEENVENLVAEDTTELSETNLKECIEAEEKTSVTEGDDTQENEKVAATVDKKEIIEGGAITSPSKDIPYAVGLLPLKTALEKLQAITDYHPRKTRSASSSKESTEMPASRLKRKSSTTGEGSEKKLKSDDGDCENENVVAEELEDCADDIASESCTIDATENNMVTDSSVPEEPMETGEVENKVEPLPSMMELVSDPSETV
ncbi:hypothetical protein L9F63_019762 [Diploptera punctata]|uniref:Uncharacterized protein n=1 Tax=Diploptera punctata TaxID=6984 RepID=A0AAD8EDM4_DIPPU|nr:hypothetical protein L9F63_019762 [Diploptera punctata]